MIILPYHGWQKAESTKMAGYIPKCFTSCLQTVIIQALTSLTGHNMLPLYHTDNQHVDDERANDKPAAELCGLSGYDAAAAAAA